jgi:hypothetical protein
VKNPLIVIIFLLVSGSCLAQEARITSSDLKTIRKKEDSLKVLVKNTFIDSLTAGRMRNDSLFIRTLVRALQVKNSFYYGFDSILGVSKVYAPDSTFKIFTWQIDFNGLYIRQRGAIQYRTADGSLRLTPLRDYSEFAENPMDSVRDKDTWIGAVYYNVIKNEHNGKAYYTLFGYDSNSPRSNKKWIDVMTFDNRNQPVFGGPFFTFEKDSIKKPTQHRFGIEYKKEASTTVNYEPDLQMILIDHLVSETDEPELAHTLVPDGDYEGFKWVNGKWQHIDKVFTESADMKGVDMYMGNPPVGDALLDKDGNRDEKKLQDKSDKNSLPKNIPPSRGKPVPQKPVKNPKKGN